MVWAIMLVKIGADGVEACSEPISASAYLRLDRSPRGRGLVDVYTRAAALQCTQPLKVTFEMIVSESRILAAIGAGVKKIDPVLFDEASRVRSGPLASGQAKAA